MKTLKLLAFSSLFLISGIASAQKLASENTIELTGKAKRGYLGNVVVDDAKQQLDLVFVTKSTNRKVKFDVYQFDYDLKLINQFSDEQEAEKARAKYNWFKFRGKDQEVITGVTAELTVIGNLVFKKKETTLTYNWFTGKYSKSVKTLDKIKPKADDGKKFAVDIIGMNEAGKPMGPFTEIDETGEVIVVVGEKGKIKEDPYKQQKEFKVIKANSELDIANSGEIIFQNPQKILSYQIIQEGSIDEEEAQEGDIALIFAPIAGQGYGKIKQEDATLYTYVRIGRDGTVKEKIPFNTKVSKWKIDAVYQKDGSVFIYGLAQPLKDPEDAYFKAGQQAKDKGKNLQIVGIKEGKAIFVSAPGLDDFKNNAVKPDNQKKPNYYTGGKLQINGFDITASGDIFINAQEYSYDAVGSYRGNRYQDFLMFHFNNSGAFVKCYGVDNTQKTGLKSVADPRQDPKYYPTQSVIFEGNDKNSVYWMQFFIGNIERRQESETILNTKYTHTWWTPRKQVRMGKIDIAGAKISSFMTFGDGAGNGKKFYLMNEFPSVKINGGKQTVFIGEDTNIWGMDSSGDYLWIGKFDPANM